MGVTGITDIMTGDQMRGPETKNRDGGIGENGGGKREGWKEGERGGKGARGQREVRGQGEEVLSHKNENK